MDPQVLTSEPSTLLALGAISSYVLFAAGWTLFGIASLRARVFPVAISGLIVIGGVAGYSALLAPGGIPLGVALTALGLLCRGGSRPRWANVGNPGHVTGARRWRDDDRGHVTSEHTTREP